MVWIKNHLIKILTKIRSSAFCYHKGDLKADEHVPNKNVELRMMTSKGKKDRQLVALFGGQGTINVNSWSPDSKRFAYVSYELK